MDNTAFPISAKVLLPAKEMQKIQEIAIEGGKSLSSVMRKIIINGLNFEEAYRGYVIREDYPGGLFVGPTSEIFRTKLRSMAARFTKTEALKYIQEGAFCKAGKFVIEDCAN